jgi:hypothetical protein
MTIRWSRRVAIAFQAHAAARAPLSSTIRPPKSTAGMDRDYAQFPSDDNGNVLWHLRSKGDSLKEPREIDVTAIFPSEVIVYVHAVPTHAGISRLERPLDDRFSTWKGRTSGWSTTIVRSA